MSVFSIPIFVNEFSRHLVYSMGSTAWKGETLYSGLNLYIGGKELELDSKVEASKLPTLAGMSHDLMDVEVDSAGLNELNPSITSVAFRSPSSTVAPEVAKFVAPASFYGTTIKPKPKGPLYVDRKQKSIHSTNRIRTRHDPNAEGAVVMKAPTKEHLKKFNKK